MTLRSEAFHVPKHHHLHKYTIDDLIWLERKCLLEQSDRALRYDIVVLEGMKMNQRSIRFHSIPSANLLTGLFYETQRMRHCLKAKYLLLFLDPAQYRIDDWRSPDKLQDFRRLGDKDRRGIVVDPLF